jgi:hypothetical protein
MRTAVNVQQLAEAGARLSASPVSTAGATLLQQPGELQRLLHKL